MDCVTVKGKCICETLVGQERGSDARKHTKSSFLAQHGDTLL